MSRVAVVTGGGRGIGAATCVLLAEAGWDVCVGFHADEAAAGQVKARCEAVGVRAVTQGGDIATEGGVRSLFVAADTLGTVDVLVNNAGIVATPQRVDEMSFGRIERMFAVNAIGPFLCAREGVLRMANSRGGEGGAIVNVGSAASRIGSPNNYVDYAASKAAIDTMTLGLAKELATDGVRVNCVRPGVIDTDPCHRRPTGQSLGRRPRDPDAPTGSTRRDRSRHRLAVFGRSVVRDRSLARRERRTVDDADAR